MEWGRWAAALGLLGLCLLAGCGGLGPAAGPPTAEETLTPVPLPATDSGPGLRARSGPPGDPGSGSVVVVNDGNATYRVTVGWTATPVRFVLLFDDGTRRPFTREAPPWAPPADPDLRGWRLRDLDARTVLTVQPGDHRAVPVPDGVPGLLVYRTARRTDAGFRTVDGGGCRGEAARLRYGPSERTFRCGAEMPSDTRTRNGTGAPGDTGTQGDVRR